MADATRVAHRFHAGDADRDGQTGALGAQVNPRRLLAPVKDRGARELRKIVEELDVFTSPLDQAADRRKLRLEALINAIRSSHAQIDAWVAGAERVFAVVEDRGFRGSSGSES